MAAWLNREVGPGRVGLRRRGTGYTLCLEGRPRFLLRFEPGRCRWSLCERRGTRWCPFEPSRPCLALTDWLGQVRRSLTLPGEPRNRPSSRDSRL